ncbi:MAG: phospholipase D-like domain-containing protein [Lentisphaeraceae bacterium]|nr:phospholipase D-like domain-containing protein [Lentisphaeraceae bacterium]
MKDFNYILEKIFSDKKVSRSEKEALDKVLESKDYSESQIANLRSQLFDYAKTLFDSEDDRKVIECIEDLNKALLPEIKPRPNATAYFSPGLDCLDAINREIRSAKSSLNICVFTISDNRISDEIINAWNRGVKVRIITDDDKQYDKGSDIFMLKSKKIPLVTDSTPDHMHHKFMTADDAIVICGSYNWTRSASTRNNEDIVVLENPVIVHAFNDEFERLWKQFS